MEVEGWAIVRKQRVVGSVVAAGVVLGSLVWGAAPPAMAAGSPAEQILNLRTTRNDLKVRGMVEFNSKVYFVADDEKYGEELWETDGTEAGTKLVKDIRPGFGFDSDPEDLTVVGSKLFFTADDGVNGRELWATDGTTTALVKDIRTGSNGSEPSGLSNLNGTLFFRATDGTNGLEPWKSDGTAGGTALIADIYPGPDDSIFSDSFAVVGATAYVVARDEAYDFEVWAVTTSGATVVSDMTAGPDGSSPGDLTAVGSSVYFNANGNSGYRSIYRYDGTNLVRIKADYYPGTNFTAIDSDTIVFAATDGLSYDELWVTDGTADSAVVLKNICEATEQGSDPQNFVKMGTKVYFTADDCVNGPALWETDGTALGTKMVKDIVTVGEDADRLSPDIKYLTVVGSTLYFRATDRGAGSNDDDAVGVTSVQYGEELWKSDGTTAGTVLVKDINAEVDDGRPEGSGIDLGGGGPQIFPVLDGNIVFRACDGTTCGLWESDGTGAGTAFIANPNPVDLGSSPSFLGSGNNKAFFNARDDVGSGLFVTDGTVAGTTKLTTRYVEEGVVLNGKLIFSGADDSAGRELWISDGTPGGTALLKDIYPGTGGDGPNGSEPGYFTVAGPYVYFRAMSTDGRELWRTDGTAEGTIMLTNVVVADYPYGVDPEYLTAVGSQVYFQGRTADTGSEPWKSNGTVEGTMMVKDINPGGDYYSGSYPYGFVKAGTTVFFTADTPTTGREVWKTDGTSAGTSLVKDIRPGEQYPGEAFDAIDAGNRESFVALGNKAYFSANDGSGGQQLWTSDGTAAGTYKVKQVSTYEYTSGPNPIVFFKNRLYFRVRESNDVERMWSSDGTEAGTAVFKDVSPDEYNWRSAGDRLYFTAGDQIWQTDGTAAGTTQVTTDLRDIYSVLPFRGGLLFRANNGTNGREPWSVGLPVGTAQTISFTPPANMKANETYALSATATSGLPVTFSAVGNCYIKTSGKNAGKLKLEGQGFCTVTASQAGDNTWARADDVQAGILIAKNSVTVAFVKVIPAITPRSVSPLANASGLVQLQAQVTPALEGCVVQFAVTPNGAPAGPYLGVSDEDGVVLSEPITLGSGTYDFTVTPLGDCEGSPVDAPGVYLGDLPPTGANTVNLLAVAVAMLAAGAVIMVGARRRRHA